MVAVLVSKIVMTALIGSTIPDNIPSINERNFFFPEDASGIDIIAPSGRFCMAIPIERVRALSIGITFPNIADAVATPTQIPSGMLWRVTANIIFFVVSSPFVFSGKK